ncbi:MAG: hypothetical protein WKG00_04240 [Polyangiaceae bacterium]
MVLIVGALVARAGDLPPRFSALLYRGVLSGAVLSDYLLLREILPVVRPDSVDGSLLLHTRNRR